ncbi:diguanylate cyclase (GGDEF) domain-containing protein [Parafrankia irregularis]|uniref:Diguanylate cyclase (GGDEF) domain-containing protein n=3 Tax=Parafrankia TaxID=2994362 RepID=A0A0S4QLZ1_9ACTN|nr:EAL domain-containing protein [Parafrankia sp. CH37]CUU56249.1 diguanylate cyclase (GGDEF) domain-containing protein [Parafrankia irregularis]
MAWLWTSARLGAGGRLRARIHGDLPPEVQRPGQGVPKGGGGQRRSRAVGDRGFFMAPPLLGSVFLLLLVFVPGSPGHLDLSVAVGAGLGVATVAAMSVVATAHLRPLALVASSVTVAAVTAALAAAESAELALTLLFWFPWVGSQVGLVWSRIAAVGVHAAVVVAVALGAFSLHGWFTEFPLAAAGCGMGVLAAAFLTHMSLYWAGDRSLVDRLTALASRAGLMRTGDPLVAGIVATGRQAVLMVVDVDHFKEINTALGYEAGDEVLRRFADCLCPVRPAPRLIARLGGDTFALLIPGAAVAGDGESPPRTADLALADFGRAILRQVDGRLRINGVDVEVEATAGLAGAPSCGNRIIDLLRCADAALADARRCGERVGVWTTGMAAVKPWELELHAQLRSAIERDELELHYQPMRDATTGRTVGVEALMRWRHPTRGLLPPGSFLPMAERSSLIVELTWWELDEALRQCARWRAEGIPVAVSANLSPRLLVVDELPQVVAERLAAYALPPDILTLEITENALVSQPARAAAMLSELRVSGVKLSMDDFGTGYNSMEILKALTFDEIKIDRSFVADAQGSLPDVAIVRSVVDLGHRLGVRVVGEGIEDEPSERILTELGCDLLQGFAFSPPLPAQDLTPLLTDTTRRDTHHRAVSAASVAAPPGPPGHPITGQPAGKDTEHARQAAATKDDNGRPADDDNGRPADAVVTQQGKDRWTRGGLIAPVPAGENDRLAALRSHRLLDTPAEPEFDLITALAAELTDCSYAHIAFVDTDREWFKSWHGLKITGFTGRVGVASHAVWSGEYLEVVDATRDMRFAHAVRADPNVPLRFFAGMPLRTPEGHALGALCVSDRMPRQLAPGQRRSLHHLAAQTMLLCDARRERLMNTDVADALERLDQFWHPDDLPSAARLTADVVRSLAGADAVAVMLAKMPYATVFDAAGTSVSPGTEPLTRVGARAGPDDEAALSALSQLRAPIFIADPSDTPLIPSDRARQLEIGSALVVPMPDEGGLLGFVAVRWTRPLARVDPVVLRAVTLFTASARFTLHHLRSTARRTSEHGRDG